MIEILRLHETDQDPAVERCAEVLGRGGLVVLPTDTVYGLAARVDMPEAVAAVFALKGRDNQKALVVMVSSSGEAEKLAAPSERGLMRRLGAALWPGPLTLVAKAGDIPWKESIAPGSDTLGLRVPDSPFLLRLLEVSGPLAVTSANPAGRPAPVSFEEIDAGLLGAVGFAIDGGGRGSGKPSTIVEIEGNGIKVLRLGEIGEDELREALMHGHMDRRPRPAVSRTNGEGLI